VKFGDWKAAVALNTPPRLTRIVVVAASEPAGFPPSPSYPAVVVQTPISGMLQVGFTGIVQPSRPPLKALPPAG
jgi:hypothetical protein